MTTDEMIADLREKLAAATPGPWHRGAHYIGAGGEPHDPDSIVGSVGLLDDARLIVAAVNALPALLDEIERLRAWKAEALIVHSEWEETWVAAGRPGRLGASKAVGVRDEIERLRTVSERVAAARGDHPACDRHSDGDPVTCGWKAAVLDIDAALEASRQVGGGAGAQRTNCMICGTDRERYEANHGEADR